LFRVARTPIQQRSTPSIPSTPSQTLREPLSGTVVSETPTGTNKEKDIVEQKAEASNISMPLLLLGEALGDISNIKITAANKSHVENAKTSLEDARSIALKPTKEEQAKTEQTMNKLAKDVKDIKSLLTEPTFAQVVATGQPTTHPLGSPYTQRKSTTRNNQIKKQRDKLTITITATAAPNSTKSQLKSMYAKEIIEKCQLAIADCIKEGRIPKIHDINKLSMTSTGYTANPLKRRSY